MFVRMWADAKLTEWLTDWLHSSFSSPYRCCYCCCRCCSAVLRLLIKQFIWISTMFIYLFFFEFSLSSVLAKKKKRRNRRAICEKFEDDVPSPSGPVSARHACVNSGPTDGCLGLSRCKESSPKWVRVRVLDTDQTIPDDDCLCLFIGDWFEYHLAWHTSWQTDDGCGCVSVGGWVFSLTQYVNLPIWQFSTSCSSH